MCYSRYTNINFWVKHLWRLSLMFYFSLCRLHLSHLKVVCTMSEVVLYQFIALHNLPSHNLTVPRSFEMKFFIVCRINLWVKKLHCICHSKNIPDLMICCSDCSNWFHEKCVKVESYVKDSVDITWNGPFCIDYSKKHLKKWPEHKHVIQHVTSFWIILFHYATMNKILTALELLFFPLCII